MKKPRLKLYRCHRGANAGAIRASIKAYPARYRKIQSGPLKGCMHREVGENKRSIFKVGKGFVLEFCLTIRVTL